MYIVIEVDIMMYTTCRYTHNIITMRTRVKPNYCVAICDGTIGLVMKIVLDLSIVKIRRL